LQDDQCIPDEARVLTSFIWIKLVMFAALLLLLRFQVPFVEKNVLYFNYKAMLRESLVLGGIFFGGGIF
jgi:hypothetical protein